MSEEQTDELARALAGLGEEAFCGSPTGYDGALAVARARPVAADLSNVRLNPTHKRGARPLVAGYVYLLSGAGSTKVGATTRLPGKRLKSIQAYSPVRLSFDYIAALKDPYGVECALHAFFRTKNTHGEWFVLGASGIALAVELLKEAECAGL